jgi:uncharacterized iron-regulated membrane protein
MLRSFAVAFHRYAGLGMAIFLVLVALTGSIIAWQDELDAWLNPELLRVPVAEPLAVPDLAQKFEADHPGARLSYIEAPAAPGSAAKAYVRNWAAADGRPLNQLLLNPSTGEVLGARSTFDPRPTRAEIIPWLYRFHYSLTLGSAGSYLLGAVALLWTIDCFIGLWLTLPRGRPFLPKWGMAWRVRRTRLNFDLHRASGLWLWPILFVLAFSGVYFNLFREVFTPLMNTVSTITPRPYNDPALAEPLETPPLSWVQAAKIAQEQIGRRVDSARLGNMSYDARRGYYRAGFHTPADPMASRAGAQVYINALDASTRALHLPGEGTAADVVMEWQFPLHSGHALGTVGRAIVSVAGVLIAMLSVTGVVIWWRKRFGRRQRSASFSTVAEPLTQQ